MRTGQIPTFEQASNPPLKKQNSLRLNLNPSESLVPNDSNIKQTNSPRSPNMGARVSINSDHK